MPKNGGTASIFIQKPGSSSAAFNSEGCTRIGSTLEFYITDRDKSWWDPAHVPVIAVGGTPVTPADIDYAAGIITLASYSSGAVTASGYFFTPEWLGGGYGFDVQPKTDKKEVTTFPKELNTIVRWRRWIATLKDWTAKVSRHYWYGKAWTLMDCSAGNSDLVWTWKSYGTPGNLEQVEYVEGGSLAVSRTSNKTTVTIEAGTTTAAAVKAAIEADPTLAELWEVDHSGSQTGVGLVEAKTAQTCEGGRDHSQDIARLGTKVLVRFYLDVQSASLEILSGVAHVEGVPLDCKLDEIIDADLTLQGDGRLKYHTI
jgi:hypothetical protein